MTAINAQKLAMSSTYGKVNTRHYWGITQNGVVCYEGTFNECWEELTATFPDKTMGELEAMKTRISRIK